MDGSDLCLKPKPSTRSSQQTCQELGLPLRRRRLYAVAVKKSSLAWLGDNESPDVTQHFMGLLRRSPALNGDIFAGIDDPQAIADLRADFARKRGCFSNFDEVPFMSLFSARTQERIQAAVDKPKPKKKAAHHHNAADQEDVASGPIIVDISQSESRPRRGVLLPAVTKSCVLVSMTKHHIFTPSEIEFAMGWPVLDVGGSGKYADLLPQCLQGLSTNARKKLAGNGMCLQQVLSWLTYVMAHVVHRSELLRWQPPLRRRVCPRPRPMHMPIPADDQAVEDAEGGSGSVDHLSQQSEDRDVE